MLCDSYAISQKEFEQIFALDESVFALWDTDNNGKSTIIKLSYLLLGLIDSIEFFCALVIFSSSRVEDKIRCIQYLLFI